MNTNSGEYLSLISKRGLQDGILSEEELTDIQGRLWALLGKRTERFTMGDSSSVPIETAQELLKSICFSIDMHLKSSSDSISLLKNENMETLLELGWAEIEMAIATGKELLKKAKTNAPPIENISLDDTLKGISSFFRKYDYRFLAHEIPCNIDYQLCHAVPEDLQGIEYINEYLSRLVIENELCRRFDTGRIKMLLKSYCPEYKELLINIYEPVVTNAVGLALLNGDIASLDITASYRNQLLSLFRAWSKKEAVEALCKASEKLLDSLEITDDAEKDYLKLAVVNLYPRIETILPTNKLDGIFLSLYQSELIEASDAQFIDNDMMDDEELRVLIEEISSCRYLSDKVAIFKQQVHSLRDCIEVLDNCFWDEDCIELYDALDSTMLKVLLSFIYQKQNESPDWRSKTGWEQQLIKYVSK